MDLLNRTLRVVSCLLVLLIASAVSAATPGEYEVKAVFLFNFTQFVEWPSSAFAGSDAPLVIGVLGEDPFGSALDQAVVGETINGRPLAVRRYRSADEVSGCHILFVGVSKTKLATTLAQLRPRSILTVSDLPDFARQGGIIQFVTVANRIRLQINLDAATQARLTISSKLLRPSEIVSTAQR